jgi:hypothetical protein
MVVDPRADRTALAEPRGKEGRICPCKRATDDEENKDRMKLNVELWAKTKSFVMAARREAAQQT